MRRITLPRRGTRTISDAQALNQLAVFMGSHEQWNGGDVCEVAAELLSATGRPPVSDQTDEDLAMYRKFADRLGWGHDGE